MKLWKPQNSYFWENLTHDLVKIMQLYKHSDFRMSSAYKQK